VARLNGFGGRYDKEIGKMANEISQRFMKKYPNKPNSFYQKAIYLKYENMFSDA
jgi:outer membrane protein assembly factor BamD (BamD/ComL family)